MALIYDVGVHNGADSAYYLSLGHKVIGIEASPVMASALTERFASQIEDGTYSAQRWRWTGGRPIGILGI